MFNLRNERNTFNLRADKATLPQKQPLHGPWYLVFMKPNWVLKAQTFPTSQEESTVMHPDLWDSIVPSLVSKYDIKDPTITKKLMSLCYGMPRGRVVYKPKDPKPFWFCYAKDAIALPGLNFQILKRAILDKFNLNEMFLAGKVVFKVDEHEMMNPGEYKQLMALLNQASSPKPIASVPQIPIAPTKREKGDMALQKTLGKEQDFEWLAKRDQWKARTSD